MSGPILIKALDIWGKIHNYVTAGLALAVVVTSVGWYITDLKLDAEKLGRQNDRAKYAQAQKDYEIKAYQYKQEVERKSNEERRKADIAYNDLDAKYRANLRLYASTKGALSRYNLPGSSGSTPSSDRPSQGTDLLTEPYTASRPLTDFLIITMDDANICAENTARVYVTHEWYNKVKGKND